MAKMIGMSRNINIQWLNKTVELINEGHSAADIKDLLNEYLSFVTSSEFKGNERLFPFETKLNKQHEE